MKTLKISLLFVVLVFGLNACTKGKITLANYEKVSTGMSVSQVENIMGCKGEELSKSELPAIPGFTEGLVTVMYSWKNGDGSNMVATFQNDRLTNKAQALLR